MFPKSPFGQQPSFSGFGATNSTILFGQSLEELRYCGPPGAIVKYRPTDGSDSILIHGKKTTIRTKYCCISRMEEYAHKSLEELRFECYLAYRKGRQQTAGAFHQAQAAPRPFSGPSTCAAPSGLFGTATENKSLFGQPSTTTGFGSPSTDFGTTAETRILFGKPSTVSATTPGFGFHAPNFDAANTAEKPFGGMTADNKSSMGHSFTSTVAVNKCGAAQRGEHEDQSTPSVFTTFPKFSFTVTNTPSAARPIPIRVDLGALCNLPSKRDEEEEKKAVKSNSSPEAPGGSQVAKADAILLKLDQIANGNFELKGLLQGLSEATCKVKNSQPFIITEKDWNYCLSKLSETVESVDKMKRYLRRNYLEIHGIPEEHNEDIYQIVIKVANSLGVQLCKDHLDEVYRLSIENAVFPQPIIVKFTNRWKRDEILAEKIRRKDVSTVDLGFSVENCISIYDYLQTS